MRRLLKFIAPKSFNDGLSKCNNLGKNLIIKNKVNRFLDLGCADGEFTLKFAKVLRPEEIYGVEIVDKYCNEAKRKGVKCVKFDLNSKWKFDNNYFDFILSSQNIEHLHNTRLYMEECYRCLKKGGQLLILTENLASWINIWSLIFGWQPFSTTLINGWSIGNPCIWHSQKPSNNTGKTSHVRVLAFKGLKDIMQHIGLKDVQVYSRGYLPFWGKLSDILCRVDKKHGHFLIGTGIK
ncbi:MAG: class I SAM-dependent methyltransferase [Candidatus Beckwithbacteria bacterium]|nr:class I SAM-dependent methyltransferase [Candidatus Beckwithbacteria bacterium]